MNRNNVKAAIWFAGAAIFGAAAAIHLDAGNGFNAALSSVCVVLYSLVGLRYLWMA